MENEESNLVNKTDSMHFCLTKINSMNTTFVVVKDEKDVVVGIATEGDIRRSLLKGALLENPISVAMNKNPLLGTMKKDGSISLPENYKTIVENVLVKDKLYIPIVNEDKKFIYNYAETVSLSQQESKGGILIIGGAGYLGSIIAVNLAKNHQVVVFDNFTYGIPQEITKNPNIKMVKGDIRNIQQLSNSIAQSSAVIFLAGYVGDPASSIDPKTTIDINYFAVLAAADICKYYGIKKFIFASTCSVYGQTKGDEFLTEESELNPVSIYANSKIACENALLMRKDKLFDPLILRMGTLYGPSPRMRFDLVINLFVAKAIVEKTIEVHGGNQWRPFIDVRDAAAYYVSAIDNYSGGIYNLSSENKTISEIADLIKLNFETTQINKVAKIEDRRNYKVSNDKIKPVFGNLIKHTIAETIKDIANMKEIQNYTLSKYNNYEFLVSLNQIRDA